VDEVSDKWVLPPYPFRTLFVDAEKYPSTMAKWPEPVTRRYIIQVSRKHPIGLQEPLDGLSGLSPSTGADHDLQRGIHTEAPDSKHVAHEERWLSASSVW